MPQPRKILVNVSAKQPLALSTSPALGTIANFYQGDTEATELYFYESNGLGGLTALDLTGATVKYGLVGGQGLPTGTLGGPSVVVYQDDWTYNPFTKNFTGTVSYNTQGVVDFLGDAAKRGTTLEIKLLFPDGSGPATVLQWPVTFCAEVIEGTVSGIINLPGYYAQSEPPTGTISDGSLWADTGTGVLYVFAGGGWVSATSAGEGLMEKQPVDGIYEVTADSGGTWLRLWDTGTNSYRKIWWNNGALNVE